MSEIGKRMNHGLSNRILWSLFLVALLTPLIWAVVHSGFVIDDWGIFSYVRGTYGETVAAFFPSSTFRPLVPLWVGAQALLLGSHPILHSALNTALFIVGHGLMALILARLSIPRVGVVYLLVASRALVSPVFVFSPATFSYINLSFALIMGSLYLEVKWLQDRHLSFKHWWTIGALLWLGLSCYEAMVPLLVWHICVPHFLRSRSLAALCSLRDAWREVETRRALRVVTLVVLLIIFHQTIVTPAIGGRQMSRLHPNWKGLLPWNLVLLEFRILAQIVRDLSTQVIRAFQLPVSGGFGLGVVSGLLGLAAYLLWPAGSMKRSRHEFLSKWFYLAALSVVASGFGFVLSSGVPIDTHGYNSRFLQWVAVSLGIGFALIAGQARKWPVRIVCGIGLVLPALIFMRVAESYARNFELQDQIVSQTIAKIESGEIPLGASIAAHLPLHSKKAFWDEPVFLEPWDFSMALRLRSAERLRFGFVIHPKVGFGAGKTGLMVQDWELPLSPMVVMRFCEDNEKSVFYTVKQPLSAQDAMRAFAREAGAALCDPSIPSGG